MVHRWCTDGVQVVYIHSVRMRHSITGSMSSINTGIGRVLACCPCVGAWVRECACVCTISSREGRQGVATLHYTTLHPLDTTSHTTLHPLATTSHTTSSLHPPAADGWCNKQCCSGHRCSSCLGYERLSQLVSVLRRYKRACQLETGRRARENEKDMWGRSQKRNPNETHRE